MKTRNTVLLALLGLIFLFVINYLLFTGMLQGLPPAVKDALKSDMSIQVDASFNNLVIKPTNDVNVGLVMYAEGKEDVRTYAPIARMLAESGIKVVIISRRLETRASEEKSFERIAAVLRENPDLDWYIGGHTSGARIPVKYAMAHIDSFHGIVLWAARLSEDSDLSTISLPVLYVYGTLDDENVNLIQMNKRFVPSHTTWVSIEGANRADFSYWGPMAADVGSTIPIPEIQRQASEATKDFLFP